MKVLHLVSSGGLFGAEQVILNLAGQPLGMHIYVGALYNRHNPHLEMIEEAQKRGFNTVTFDSKGQMDFATIFHIRKFLRENKIDILHTHNYKSDIVGYFARQGTNSRWVATNHTWHSTDQKLWFYELIDAFILRSADKVIGVAQGVIDSMLRKGIDSSKLIVVDNGIAISRYTQMVDKHKVRVSYDAAADEFVVIIVGRLAPEKGHEIFLKAAAAIIQTQPKIKFVIVGDGPLRNHLEQMASDLNICHQVKFTGIRKDMAEIYASADVMVNASSIEGLPMTILEAMASRLPVVATDVGAVGLVINNNKNGILLKYGEVQSMVDALINLIHDNTKRKLLSDQAFEDVTTRFSDVRMARRYQEIYNSLC